jgi:DNA (cytosine-5)-methyltransferase 1
MNEKPTHLDLCSGIGGFALAFESEGFQTIGFSEIDSYASKILKRHWPHVPNYGDIGTVPECSATVVTAGFPCQPYSVSNQSKRDDDPRKLWPQVFGVIGRVRPTFALFENVDDFVNVGLDGVTADLEGQNYSVESFIVPALAVGAIHRRDRVWIVGHSNEKRFKECGNQFDGPKRDAPFAIQWPTESPICGTTDGVPCWVDRIGCLGNAISPAIARIFANAMRQLI